MPPRSKAPGKIETEGRLNRESQRYRGRTVGSIMSEPEYQARERTAMARARSAEARAARDEAPSTRGPKAPLRGPKAPSMPTMGLSKALRGFAARNPRRVILAELLAAVVIVTVGRVSEGEVPRPSDYLAPFVVYLVLAFAAEVGGGPARFAMGLGGLVLLAMVMANVGGILRVLEVVTVGSPTTYGAQGFSGFQAEYGEVGQGTAGGGGGGSW